MSTKRSIVSARKRTPVASKSWKENLRQACLHRVRQRRSSPEALTDNEDMLSPRLLVEHELREHGVMLISPFADRNQQHFTPQVVDHHISEEELFELLQEVEEEMQRSDGLYLEEMIKNARDQEQYLENQIADYQQWEESKTVQASIQVLCPICQEANLTKTPNGDIVCPNHMDGSCAFYLADKQGTSLFDLRERLRQAYEQHNAHHCQNSLCFEITPETSELLALCSACDTMIRV